MSENEMMSLSDELKAPMAIGEIFAKSGMFPDAKSQSQAVVKILAGRELGLSPFQSMSNIIIVNGRLGLAAQSMAGLVNKSKEYRYVVKSLTDEGCTIELLKNDQLVGSSTFGKAEASKAGLINKDIYKNYPRNMYFARALSNACKWYCPEIIQGYMTLEELRDIDEVPAKTSVSVSVPVAEAEVIDGKA